MLNRRVGRRPSAPWFLFTCCVGAVTLGQAREPATMESRSSEPGSIERESVDAEGAADPVQRFLARVDEPLTRYRAVRTLRARNKRFNKEGWIMARTELDPTAGFTYQILGEGGSGYIRSRVLRKTLEGERKTVAAGESSRVALSPANYRFSTAAPAAPPTAALDTLRIIPLRKDKLLIDGTITVSAADGDLVQIAGRLVKNPSFWTNRVEIVRRYGRIEGIRVPLAIESIANVKIAGTSIFSMTYEYESINGRPVTAGAQTAAAAPLSAAPLSAARPH